jgi:hypothetical protein
MKEPKERKPTPGIHDEDLDLGHILHTYDANHLGAHPLVDALLKPKPKLRGRQDKPEPMLVGGQVSGGGSSALDANQSGGLHPGAISGETSTKSPPPVSDDGGVMETQSAGNESDSANSNRQ